MRPVSVAAALAGIVVLVFAAYVRLAPFDPARWHVDILAPGFDPPAYAAAFCPAPDSRFSTPGASAESALAAFESVVLTSPRTRRIAGSPAEGRVTWQTRSAIWGFPDYTTASTYPTVAGAQLCVISRQRFGRGDFGVNARRLRGWLQQWTVLVEAPDLQWNPPLND